MAIVLLKEKGSERVLAEAPDLGHVPDKFRVKNEDGSETVWHKVSQKGVEAHYEKRKL